MAVARAVDDLDPFSTEFLADPYPAHAALREADDVVWLERNGIWVGARYSSVLAALRNWAEDLVAGDDQLALVPG